MPVRLRRARARAGRVGVVGCDRTLRIANRNRASRAHDDLTLLISRAPRCCVAVVLDIARGHARTDPYSAGAVRREAHKIGSRCQRAGGLLREVLGVCVRGAIVAGRRCGQTDAAVCCTQLDEDEDEDIRASPLGSWPTSSRRWRHVGDGAGARRGSAASTGPVSDDRTGLRPSTDRTGRSDRAGADRWLG